MSERHIISALVTGTAHRASDFEAALVGLFPEDRLEKSCVSRTGAHQIWHVSVTGVFEGHLEVGAYMSRVRALTGQPPFDTLRDRFVSLAR